MPRRPENNDAALREKRSSVTPWRPTMCCGMGARTLKPHRFTNASVGRRDGINGLLPDAVAICRPDESVVHPVVRFWCFSRTRRFGKHGAQHLHFSFTLQSVKHLGQHRPRQPTDRRQRRGSHRLTCCETCAHFAGNGIRLNRVIRKIHHADNPLSMAGILPSQNANRVRLQKYDSRTGETTGAACACCRHSAQNALRSQHLRTWQPDQAEPGYNQRLRRRGPID
ncbi:MAG: hypothetical protein ACI9OU_001520 [Candidatus Promineifilaceae bacterium]|jgi:hypothetical protein